MKKRILNSNLLGVGIYFLLSIYVFVQASFFPQKIAQFLIRMFQPRIGHQAILFSPDDHVRYYNIVLYAGLGIFSVLLSKGFKGLLRIKANHEGIVYRVIATLLTVGSCAMVYLCTVMIYRLFHGEETGLFSLSSTALIPLAVLLIFVAHYSYVTNRKGVSTKPK